MLKHLISVSFFILMLLISSNQISAQISYGGEPYSFSHPLSEEAESIYISPADRKALQTEDLERDSRGELYRVGVGLPVNLSISSHGTWEAAEHGSRVWRLQISSPGAEAIGLYFSDFWIPEGGQLFVYNYDQSKVLGSYTYFNNPAAGLFAIEPIQGDEITIEYLEPSWARNEAILTIYELGYMYRGYGLSTRGGEYNTSEDCEVDAVCSEANNWRPQQRSVAKILVKTGSDYGFCTGSLVNNTEDNCFPYFLTADHCGEDASFEDVLQWVFYFKYERSNCNLSTESEPSYISMSGGQKKANGANNAGSKSDFFLLQLNSYVPSAVGAYFNGWKTTNVASTSGVCIHHPAGDVKKISTYTSTLTNYYTTHWSAGWTGTTNGFGVTEGGSSGSPLFNPEGLVIGTLTGGLSACTVGGAGTGTGPTQKDIYGKFSYHWASNGTTAANRLKDWLAPTGLNPATWPGRENNCETLPLVADFFIESNVIPVGTSVTFRNLTLYNPDFSCTYLWEFEGVVQSPTTIITSPLRTFNTNGIFEVKLTATNNGVSNTKTVLMYVGNVGIEEEMQQTIKVFPNPASTSLNVDLSSVENPNSLTLTDMMGKVVLHLTHDLQGSIDIPVSELATGLYQLQINTQTQSYTRKISIVR